MSPLRLSRALAGCLMAAAVLVSAGCATPPPAADAALLQRMDAVLRQAAPSRPVALRLNPETITTGRPLEAGVASPMGGFVYLFQLGTDGKTLDLVFPNAQDGANQLQAGQPMPLPRANWRLMARGPAGLGYLMAVVTQQPQDLQALQAGVGMGQLPVRGLYGAAMATLREVAP